MQLKNRPIGIFDSGVGGLTVVKEVMRELPNEQIIYFGDNKRAPYGSKNKDIILQYAKEIINFLISKDVKVIVIACNTISAIIYNELLKEFNIHIIEIITSGAEAAVKITKNNKVCVIGTKLTISSSEYEKKIKYLNKNIEVYSKECELFVPIVEQNLIYSSVAKEICTFYLNNVVKYGIDTIVLGCTHYPFLIEIIKDIVGDIKIINPAYRLAVKIKEYLIAEDLIRCNEDKLRERHIFYTSGEKDKFEKICNGILSNNISVIEKIL